MYLRLLSIYDEQTCTHLHSTSPTDKHKTNDSKKEKQHIACNQEDSPHDTQLPRAKLTPFLQHLTRNLQKGSKSSLAKELQQESINNIPHSLDPPHQGNHRSRKQQNSTNIIQGNSVSISNEKEWKSNVIRQILHTLRMTYPGESHNEQISREETEYKITYNSLILTYIVETSKIIPTNHIQGIIMQIHQEIILNTLDSRINDHPKVYELLLEHEATMKIILRFLENSRTQLKRRRSMKWKNHDNFQNLGLLLILLGRAETLPKKPHANINKILNHGE